MEGFTKIPNWLLDAGLTTSEIGVLIHLLRVQSYREYKGEIKDGWFAKSQNELARECGIKSNHTLTSILKGIAKNAILEYKSDGKVTYFKINIVENAIPIAKNTIPIAKNAIPTIAENATQGIAKNANLHKNNIQEILKDIHTQDIVTYNTSNSDISPIENLKEDNKENNIDTVTKVEDNLDSIPFFKNRNNKKIEELLSNYTDNEGEPRIPTKDELLCIVFLEDLSFSKNDFKDCYTGCSANQIMLSVSSKIGKMVSKHNFKYSALDDVYRTMIKSYLDTNTNYFKIDTSVF